MKNTPSALKWLAEKRARVAFDLQLKQQILKDLEDQIAELQTDLASLDRSITIFDKRIDPNRIEPVNGWKGSYGKRGALKEAISGFIQAASPNPISTRDLETLVCLKFGIAFITPKERWQWREGGFRSAIQLLVKDGRIERANVEDSLPGQIAYFRWKAQATSLESLARTIATKEDSGVLHPTP